MRPVRPGVDVTFEMSSLEAHRLLQELEFAMQFANRNGVDARRSWYIIACQLNGATAADARAHADKREDEYQAKLAAERAEEERKAEKQSWYRRLIG